MYERRQKCNPTAHHARSTVKTLVKLNGIILPRSNNLAFLSPNWILFSYRWPSIEFVNILFLFLRRLASIPTFLLPFCAPTLTPHPTPARAPSLLPLGFFDVVAPPLSQWRSLHFQP